MQTEYTYEKIGNLVRIKSFFNQDATYTKEYLQQAIQNVKDRRSDYSTQEAFDRHLSMLTGALMFLEE